jgi:hypothetical protein
MLVFIEHGSRRMHLGGVTAHPAGDWAVQQARSLALTLGVRFEDIRLSSASGISLSALLQADISGVSRRSRGLARY